MPLKKFLNLFNNSTPLKIQERNTVFDIQFQLNFEELPEIKNIQNVICKFPERDLVKVFLSDDTDNTLTIDRAHEFRDSELLKSLDNDTQIKVQLHIQKEKKEGKFSIYNFEKFSEYIRSKSIFGTMELFAKLLDNEKAIVFELFDSVAVFATNTLIFRDYTQDVIINDYDRLKQLQKCKENSCFFTFEDVKLLPGDFDFLIDCAQNPFKDLFREIETVLALIFISDRATIENKRLEGQIQGKRILNYELDLENTNILHNKVIVDIYNWIYTDGNLFDKAVLARNIISMHCQYVDILQMDERTFLSIQSNYKIYQQNNIQHYIEVKKQLGQYVLSTVDNVSDIIIGFSDKIKSNFIAFVTFVFTVALVNIVSNSPLDNIFTKDITLLLELILGGSFMYLLISKWEFDYKLKSIEKGYGNIKKVYLDLLDEQELEKVFNNEMIKGTLKEANSKRNIYIVIWIVSIVVGFIAIEFLSSSPIVSPLIKKWF